MRMGDLFDDLEAAMLEKSSFPPDICLTPNGVYNRRMAGHPISLPPIDLIPCGSKIDLMNCFRVLTQIGLPLA